MKRELRLYINNADNYKEVNDEPSAYRMFVERIELILAEEQQLYWQVHAKPTNQNIAASSENEKK